MPTSETVKAIVDAEFPELAPATVALLGEGYDCCAFEVNGTWVFRFPKREDVESQLRVEARLLPQLAPRLPLPVPRFELQGRGFAGYRKLPGIPAIGLTPSTAVARPVGEFLRALHSFPVDDALRAGVPERPIDGFVESVREDALSTFEEVVEVAPGAPLDAWYGYLRDAVPRRFGSSRVLAHFDLAAEHILVDPTSRAPTGVIDWSDVAVSDRAADLAGVVHWGGEELLAAVVAHYGETPIAEEVAVARYLAACRGVADVVFGRKMGRREYVDAGVEALFHAVPS